MRLTLLVSDLLPPPELVPEPPRAAYREVETLLGRGGAVRGSGAAFEAALFRIWNIEGIPAAAFTALADGLEAPEPDHVWMRADPVHLHIERDHIQLIEAQRFDLAQHESDALVATLNRHFAQDGLRIEAPHPVRWYTQVPAADAPASTPLWDVAGRSMFEHLPAPSGSADWKSRGNEAQMALFEHPVNVSREARGAVPVNGVWFWGAGAAPGIVEHRFDAVFADDALTLGVALHAGIPAAPLQGFDAIDRSRAGNTLVALDTLSAGVRTGDPQRWAAAAAAVRTDWFTPALAALRAGGIEAIRVVAPSMGVTLDATTRRTDLLKFWRRLRLAHDHA